MSHYTKPPISATAGFSLAAAAAAFAGGLLALQIIGASEHTAGGTPYEYWSMVGTMVTVAVLPIFIHMGWRLLKPIGIALGVAFAAFLWYSMPANVGRIGEAREAKAASAGDASKIKSQIDDINRTLRYAEPDQIAECAGAPAVIPAGKWPECRRKTGTVTALKNDRTRLEGNLAKLGNGIGDTGSTTTAWAMSAIAPITATSIRKSAGLSFAVGLEVAIWSLVWLATRAIEEALAALTLKQAIRRASNVTQFRPRAELDQVSTTTDAEIDEAKRILVPTKRYPVSAELMARGLAVLSQEPEISNNDLAVRIGCSPSCASKIASNAALDGLASRSKVTTGDGRKVAISAA